MVCKEMIMYGTFTYIGKIVTWKHYNACQLPMIVWSQVNNGRDDIAIEYKQNACAWLY